MPEEKQESQVVVQSISKRYDSKIKAGIAYYTFITAINNIKLSPRELQLLAFVNYRGTISSASARKDFCTIFNSSEATISNMVSKLFGLRLLIKDKLKTKINPALSLDFSKDVVIRLFINTEDFTLEPEIREEQEDVKINEGSVSIIPAMKIDLHVDDEMDLNLDLKEMEDEDGD